MDVVILFEAIYYLPSVEKFISECRRVLRDGGKVLIATANKDLYDFNPSQNSYKYYGIVELKELFTKQKFIGKFYGNTPVDKLSLRQKFFRPVKKWAVKFSLVPKTLEGKKIIKKLIFGCLVKMPAEIKENMVPFIELTKLSSSQPDNKQ
jgi:SAM-dependent methyltransferase